MNLAYRIGSHSTWSSATFTYAHAVGARIEDTGGSQGAVPAHRRRRQLERQGHLEGATGIVAEGIPASTFNSSWLRSPLRHESISLTQLAHGVIGADNMDEGSIKAEYLTRLRKAAGGRGLPTVTAEFSLRGTGIRADLAVLSDRFIGVEIKSASDTLKRLQSQMEGYERYFDQTILIVAPKHLRGLKEIELHGAEVWRQDTLSHWQLYASGEQRFISGHWLQHLLPAEAERRMNVYVDDTLSSGLHPSPDLARRAAFKAEFRRRYQSTSDRFWDEVKGRKIRRDDVKILSRFHAERESIRRLAEDKKQRWVGWGRAMEASC